MGNLSSKPERDVLMQDFYVVESIFFPRCAPVAPRHSPVAEQEAVGVSQQGCPCPASHPHSSSREETRDICSACISLARLGHMTLGSCKRGWVAILS